MATTTALTASFVRPCRSTPASFPHRHGRHRSLRSFRVQCAVESTSSDSKSSDLKSSDSKPSESKSSDSTRKSGGGENQKHVDTRIHWANEADGWIGNDEGGESAAQNRSWGSGGRSNAGLLDQASDSHYRYLGVSADAEMEEIKSAYRRLSKLYHPDSTQLPLEIAAEKFMRLKDAYDTLSNQEMRNLYDYRLATNIVSNTEGNFYGYPISSQQGYDTKRTQRRPERVDIDTLGGRNMPLSGQAATALVFDVLVLCLCVFVIIFIVFFKTHAST